MFGKFGGLGVAAVVVLTLGCSSDGGSAGSPGGSGGSNAEAGPDIGLDASQVCEPGKQEACACPGGSAGAQRCRDDGSGWETCFCSDAAVVPEGGDVVVEAPEDAPPEGGFVEAEASVPDLCSLAEAQHLTCPGTDCAACIESECDVECTATVTDGLFVMGCYCACEEQDAGECFYACDQQFLQGINGADTFKHVLACIRDNCPQECDFRPE